MLTDQLSPVYEQVFVSALAVLTTQRHFEFFERIGVPLTRMLAPVPMRVPADVFNPKPLNTSAATFTLASYGKIGKFKGTLPLLNALAILRSEGVSCRLRAHWGGRGAAAVANQLKAPRFSGLVEMNGYVAHWRIPSFIHACDAIAFLEHDFPITFHGPSIPLEALCCGRPVLTTSEIAQKQPLLRDGYNCVVLDGNAVTAEAVADCIRRLKAKSDAGDFRAVEWPDSGLINVRAAAAMNVLITELRSRLQR